MTYKLYSINKTSKPRHDHHNKQQDIIKNIASFFPDHQALTLVKVEQTVFNWFIQNQWCQNYLDFILFPLNVVLMRLELETNGLNIYNQTIRKRYIPFSHNRGFTLAKLNVFAKLFLNHEFLINLLRMWGTIMWLFFTHFQATALKSLTK